MRVRNKFIPTAEPVNHQRDFPFMGIDLSTADAPYHFLFAGMPGTGKSLSMQHLFEGLKDSAGVVYDFQKTITEKIIRHGVDYRRFRNLNPYHKLGFQWLMSRDIRTWEMAFETTAAFFPESNNSDPFWRDAPRYILAVLMTTLNRIARDKRFEARWELRDLILIATNKAKLEKMCRLYPDLWGRVEPIFKEENSQMGDSVLFTISVSMAKFQAIAQLWHRAGQRGMNLSLFEILGKHKPIFLLGREEVSGKEALDNLNAIIVNFVCKIFLDRQAENTTGQPCCWFILDELPSIAKIAYLIRAATEGRKLGLVLAIAFQSFPNLQKIYGVEDASTLTGLMGYQVFFRSNEPSTQEWLTKSIGEHQVKRPTVSNSQSKSRKGLWFIMSQITQSVSYSPVIEKLMLESEFSSLPLARDGVVEAVVKFRGSSVYRYQAYTMQNIAELDRLYPPQPRFKPLNYARTDEGDSELQDFTTDDLDRLGAIPYDYFSDVAVDVPYSETLSISAALETEE